MSTPRATVRLQLHAGFTLDDAAAQADYYARLGISHLYLSPITMSRRGSLHGYDTVDYGRVDPELGGEAALQRLVAALRALGMGLVLDFVPNHMGVGGERNAWWRDVLVQGRASRYAAFFDIDWDVPDPLLKGRVLLPILGRPYGEALSAGELRLEREADGRTALAYFERHLPLAEADARADPAAHDPAEPEGRARLHALLERQHWRLAWWRTAADEINWRRFFDINELAGLAVERPQVFDAAHAAVLRLYAEGLIDGVRIDHVDGLADPGGYLRRLRRALDERAPQRPAEALPGPAWLIVEKILAPGETLPRGWPVAGTSGYDFMEEVGLLLHDPAGARPLDQLWGEFTEERTGFAETARAARRLILEQHLAADLERALRGLLRFARSDLATRDLSAGSLRRALAALLEHVPVYRTYAGGDTPGETDAAVLRRTLAAARHSVPPGDREALEQLGAWLLGGLPARWRRALGRLEQLTPPLAAKAVEDTAFYRWGRLLSRNEVGSEPASLGCEPAAFHAAMQRRARQLSGSLLATATHDHKRGEDTRARLAVLSEIPADWTSAARAWRSTADGLRSTLPEGPAPEPADELMLYQTLVGAWPLTLSADEPEALQAYGERVAAWQEKALREAKRRSRWSAVDEAYEAACRGFLEGLLAGPLRHGFAAFAERIAPAGALNGLAQTLLRLTAPGVPDLYQGTELWDFSLVDPDNRRPVDHDLRRAALAEGGSAAARLATWRDGRVKQAVIAAGLALRRAEPALFAAGLYRPVTAAGAQADRVLAFLRQREEQAVLVVTTRLAAGLLGDDGLPRIPAARWGDTALRLPAALRDRPLRDLLGGPGGSGRSLRLADLLAELPVALLVPS